MSSRTWLPAAAALAALALTQGLAPAARAQDNSAAKAAEEPMPAFEKVFMESDAAIKTGEDVWQQQCRHCHGNSAYPGKAPKLKPGTYTPEFIFDRVTYGFKGMPPWQAVFSTEQRKSVVAYIKSSRFSP